MNRERKEALTTRHRVMVAHGAAQILFLLFALRDKSEEESPRQDVLLLYAVRPTDARRQAMEQLARKMWCWREILWLDEMLEGEADGGAGDLSSAGLDELEKVLPETVDELWVCMPRGAVEQRLMMACPTAELVLFDDGLSTYIELDGFGQWIRHPLRAYRACKDLCERGAARAAPWLKRQPPPRRWPAKRFSRAHLLLAGMLQTPRRFRSAELIGVGADGMRAVMRQAREQLAPGAALHDAVSERRVLFLPQCFHKSGGISWAEERDVYIEICSRLSDAGIDVLWKEHPKSNRPFLPEVASRVVSVVGIAAQLPDEWPIELYGEGLAVDACVSATSTSLFTLRRLWNLPTYTFVDHIGRYLTGGDRDVSKLVRRHIPPVEQLTSSAAAPPR